MKLHRKITGIVIATLVTVLGFLFLIFQTALMDGFAKVEHYNVEQNIYRVIDAYKGNVDNLAMKASDWAAWNDTYQFIVDSNKAFINSNLTDQTFTSLNLNLILMINNEGAIIYGREFKPDDFPGTNRLKKETESVFLNDKQLIHHESKTCISKGLLMLPDGPMIIVARPILDSEENGPVRGTLIFGQYLDSTEIDKLSKITHITLYAELYSTDKSNKRILAIQEKFSDKKPIIIKPINEKIISGYTLLHDVNNQPLILIGIEMARDIHKQGEITKQYLLFSLLLTGLIFYFILINLLQKQVVARIAKLNTDVLNIGEKSDHALRVTVDGADEIASLAISMNSMLNNLHTIKKEIMTRNEEMSLIMNTIPTGLLSLDENLIINPEFSKSAEIILGKKEINGKYFPDLLWPEDSQSDDKKKLLFEFLDIFRKDLFPLNELAALNPFEQLSIQINQTTHWLRLGYHQISRGENVSKHILVVIEDITEEKRLAAEIKKSEQENFQLKLIAEDPELLKLFLSDMRHIIIQTQDSLQMLQTNQNRKKFYFDIYRNIHTIKGTAASFGFVKIAEIAGKLEECLDMAKDKQILTDNCILHVTSFVDDLTKELDNVIINVQAIFGEELNESGDIQLKIYLEKLNHKQKVIKEIISKESIDPDTCSRLHSAVDLEFSTLRVIPAKRGLGKTLKIIPNLIARLNKNIAFNLHCNDIIIDCKLAYDLNTPLIHLIRNAFDHGIEHAHERIKCGKDPDGHVDVTLQILNNNLIVEVKDDGRGLNTEIIKTTALQKNFITGEEAKVLNDKEIHALIFQPGLSTVINANEISGRGMGMDIVLNSVKNVLNGKIRINSVADKGTCITIEIPLTHS